MARLLLVEDDLRLCELYRAELEAEGHEVMVAHNGKAGLQRAVQEEPDLVIMDLSFPEKMDGLESMSRILGEKNDIPVIINTAYSHYKESFLSWAAEEYVVKSGDTTPLKEAINRVLDPSEQPDSGTDETGRAGDSA